MSFHSSLCSFSSFFFMRFETFAISNSPCIQLSFHLILIFTTNKYNFTGIAATKIPTQKINKISWKKKQSDEMFRDQEFLGSLVVYFMEMSINVITAMSAYMKQKKSIRVPIDRIRIERRKKIERTKRLKQITLMRNKGSAYQQQQQKKIITGTMYNLQFK